MEYITPSFFVLGSVELIQGTVEGQTYERDYTLYYAHNY